MENFRFDITEMCMNKFETLKMKEAHSKNYLNNNEPHQTYFSHMKIMLKNIKV